MRLGIVTRYQRHEATRYALRIAEEARLRAVPCKLRSVGVRHPVSDSWDAKVSADRNESFVSWCQDLTHVLWLGTPNRDEAHWVRHRELQASCVVDWEYLQKGDLEILPLMHHVVCPFEILHAELAARRIPNLLTIPYDPGLPYTRRTPPAESGKTRMLVPLYDTQYRRVHGSLFYWLGAILKKTDLSLTLCYSGHWPVRSHNLVRDMRKTYPDSKLRILRTPTRADQLAAMNEVDLLLWPTEGESFGITGLDAVYSGIPVVAWGDLPMNEYLRHGKNAWLVETDRLVLNWAGWAQIVPEFEELFGELLELVNSPERLSQLYAKTRYGLQARRQAFSERWQRVLS